jgi:DNA-binding winged helix-turn-helix (wHTH) protein
MIHGDRSVDVFVRKLRSKLQRRSPGWEYIHTHFGIGYRFDPQSHEPEPGEASTRHATEPVDSEAPASPEPSPLLHRSATGR